MSPQVGLASYVSNPGTRVGVVLAAVLLGVPLAVFGVQVLRLGTATRERRLAALSVAGATRSDLGRLAAAAAARPAGVGAIAGLPALLLLWLALGVLPPPGARLLPAPTWTVLLCWPPVALAVVVAAAWSASAVAVPAQDNPVGRSRRVVRPLGVTARVMPVVFLLAVAGGAVGLTGSSPHVVVLTLPLTLTGAAVSLGPWLVLLIGRWLGRSRTVVTVLAGRRLVADARTPGRVAGVLLAVGLAVGIAAAGAGTVVDDFRVDTQYGGGLGYYLGGYALALAAIGFASTVAAASLVVGATETVLDARRPTAALVAMGVRPAELTAVLRRQLWAVAGVPSLLGALVGWLLWSGPVMVAVGEPHRGIGVAVALPVALGICALTALLGSGIAARLLRGPLRAATDPSNLRTA